MTVRETTGKKALRLFRMHGDLNPAQLAALLNAPTVLFMVLVLAYPLASSLWYAFHEVGAVQLRTGEMDFVGLRNFAYVLGHELFWQSLWQSFQFVGITLILQLVMGLGIALLINDKTRSSAALQALVLLPWAVPPMVNGILWGFLFNAKYGYVNVVLYKLGFIDEFVIWVQNPRLALYAVTFAFTWRTIPFAVIMLLAALQSIPEDLYEVAAVDGANAWHRFQHITLPLIQPAILVVLILRTMWTFMAFDEIFAITQGGPGYSTWVASWYTYATAFRYLKFGIGAASAYLLGAVIAILALIYVKFLYVEIEY